MLRKATVWLIGKYLRARETHRGDLQAMGRGWER